jgi:hypothetical protein
VRPIRQVMPVQMNLWGAPVPHVALLHGGARGHVALCRKDPTWLQDFFDAREVAAAASAAAGHPDTFISQNTFSVPARRVDTLRQLRALFADVDCYRVGLSAEMALAQVEGHANSGGIPWPSAALFSGRGLAVIWLLRPAPAAALPRWTAVQRYLCEALAELGADPVSIDGARVLRLAGTVNSKAGKVVQLLEYRVPGARGAIRYELADLARQYLPPHWHTSARFPEADEPSAAGSHGRREDGKPRSLRHLFTPYSLHLARLEDLKRLGELRRWDLRGHRELFCFLWRYWTCCVLEDPAEALRQALDFNSQFREPLSEREVERATRSAEKAWVAWLRWRQEPGTRKSRAEFNGYNYSNERLIELLGITPAEQRHLKTIINRSEKGRRWNEKRSKGRWHQVPMGERVQRLQEVLAAHPGATQRQLARVLGWSLGTVNATMAALRSGVQFGALD